MCLVFFFSFSWASPGLGPRVSAALKTAADAVGTTRFPAEGLGVASDLWRGKSTPSKMSESYSGD